MLDTHTLHTIEQHLQAALDQFKGSSGSSEDQARLPIVESGRTTR